MGNLPILSSKLNIFYLFFWTKSFCQKLDAFHVLYIYIGLFFQGFQAHWWLWWNTWAGQLCQRHWRLHCRGPDGLPRRRSNQLSGQRSSECSWILVLLVRRLWRHCWPQPHVSLMIIISKYLFLFWLFPASCSGLRFLSAITVSTSTRLWLVIGPSPNLIAIEAKDQAQPGRILSERFRALLLLLQASTTQDKNTDYDQVNRYCDGGRPDIP